MLKFDFNFLASNYMTTEVLLEDEDIVIHGEVPLEEDERDAGDVPVRLLEEFVIYDLNSLEAVPLERLLKVADPRCPPFSASGLVKPWIEKDTDDEEDSDYEDNRGCMFADHQWDRLSLSQIREFSVHSPSRRGRLDGYIAPRYLILCTDQLFHQENVY